MRKKFNKILALGIVIAICLSCSAFAIDIPVSPNASSYLASYGAYCYANGNGNFTVYFDVTGNGYQNYLGVSSVVIRQSSNGGSTWSTVYSFNYPSVSRLMGTNCMYYDNYVTYYGTAGYEYYAILYFWGGSSLSIGDSRTYVTTTIIAT